MPLTASVALDLKLNKTFDYSIPEELIASVSIGSQVEVPLKSTLKKGIVLKVAETTPKYTLKPIHRLLHETPLLAPDLLKVALWMSSYYCTPLPLIIPSLLPTSIRNNSKHKEQYLVSRAKTRQEIIEVLTTLRKKSHTQSEVLDYMLKAEGGVFLTELIEKTASSRSSIDSLVKKGLLHLEKANFNRSPLVGEEYFRSQPKKLSNEQQEALDKIAKSLTNGSYETHLLYGVTGSGKTEIYLQAIAKTLGLGKGVIMLVPEIALTSQTIEQFRSRFEGQIAILHYRLSDGEKHDEWKRIQSGEAQIVIGARSAIFSPIQNLGLIIVDEEHENSYKQSDQMPSYHGRDVAIMRGFYSNATVLLGSATPSLESYHNAKIGKYSLSLLKSRPLHLPMPKVTIVDMKIEYDKKKGMTIFSEALLSGIEKRQQKGEQTILFLNRRGYHTQMLCTHCGESLKCSHCDLSLTFHKNENSLSCHLCDENHTPPPKTCPHCKTSDLLKFRGIGTEQVETALHAIFPGIRTLRLDADTTKHKGSHQKLYRAFRTGKADVLIGTQMLAKGLHFPEVTLVGILNSDISLNIPDFRAGETTFQLLTQVAGRSGRGVAEGEVLIQTAIPENSVIHHASKQDFEGFFEEEYQVRELLNYPPFSNLAKVRFTGKDLTLTKETAEAFRHALIKNLSLSEEVSLINPCGHAKIKEQHRLQFIVKGPKINAIANALKRVVSEFQERSSVRIFIDINPTNLFF